MHRFAERFGGMLFLHRNSAESRVPMVPAQIFEVSVDFEEREFAAELEVAAAEERDGFVMVRSLCRVLHRLLEVTIPPHLGALGVVATQIAKLENNSSRVVTFLLPGVCSLAPRPSGGFNAVSPRFRSPAHSAPVLQCGLEAVADMCLGPLTSSGEIRCIAQVPCRWVKLYLLKRGNVERRRGYSIKRIKIIGNVKDSVKVRSPPAAVLLALLCPHLSMARAACLRPAWAVTRPRAARR